MLDRIRGLFPHNLVARVLLALWLAACTVVLGFAFTLADFYQRGEVVSYFMAFLTFPLSIPVVLLGKKAIYILWYYYDCDLYESNALLVAVWAMMVCLGYLQWFVLVPFAVRRMRSGWAVLRRHRAGA